MPEKIYVKKKIKPSVKTIRVQTDDDTAAL